ncbi:MAG: ATP-binding protein [bacterium]
MASALTFRRALLGAIALALLAGVVPAGLILDRQLAGALEARARSDLALAPAVFLDRQTSSGDARMMHAKEFAHSADLADALAKGDRARVRRIAEDARAALGGEPIVVGPDEDVWTGPAAASSLAELVPRTRRGDMPVATVADSLTLMDVALAPVQSGGKWVGAAGLATMLDEQRTAAIAGLTRADVIVFVAPTPDAVDSDVHIVATTLDTASTRALGGTLQAWSLDVAPTPPARGAAEDRSAPVHELTSGGRRFIAVIAPVGSAGSVALIRDLGAELSVLPRLRRLAFWSAVAALVLALVLGFALAARIARPMRALADASDALARGDFGAPLPDSSHIAVREVRQLATAFATMRAALAARIAELHDANDALGDRNARLTALQADLVQRERLVATGRLVTQLAHEIRNPVASLRNCLELIRRRLTDDPEGREFADLAIDELLRMHELAEQMLDVNRPRDGGGAHCRPAETVRDVAALLMAGTRPDTVPITWSLADGTSGGEVAAISADSLKQVLLNLAQNGRDAISAPAPRPASTVPHPGVHMLVRASETEVEIEVRDDGPGIAPDILAKIFDPFFTTKPDMRGVGLGLSIAEGLIRQAGGRLRLESEEQDGGVVRGGAAFLVTLPRTVASIASRSSTGDETRGQRPLSSAHAASTVHAT